MKYSITLLFGLILLLGNWNSLYAQVEGGTIEINADVIADLDITADQDLSFGTIIQNSKKYVNPVDNSADASGGSVSGVTGTEDRGFFTVDGSAGTNVDLEVTYKNSIYNGPPGTDNLDNLTLDLTPNGVLQFIVTADNPSGTSNVNAVTNGNGTAGEFTCTQPDGLTETCSSNNSVELPDGGGIVYVVVGGEVTARENQTVDNYSGDITLTATIVN